MGGAAERAHTTLATLLFLGDFSAGFSCFAEGDRDGLFPAFDLLPAAGFQFSLLMLLHHFVNL